MLVDGASALPRLAFMRSVTLRSSADGAAVLVTRCGYTGEDGVELAVPAASAAAFAAALLRSSAPGGVQWAGLAARDILRLEAGLCLYGSDLTGETTPIEAGLQWTISKTRLRTGGFAGFAAIAEQARAGPTRRRVGLVSAAGPPMRAGTDIVDTRDGRRCGRVTSGCFSPTLGRNIAMAYVSAASPAALDELCAVGTTRIAALVRQHTVPALVVRMPFVPAQYHRL